MESESASTSNDSKGFVSKVFSIDADSKASLMNGVQYIVLAIIPVAIVDSIMKKLFTESNPHTKGSIELLAEVLGQAVMTILLLFCVHKIIIAIPTYSGASMNRINYTTLALGLLMGFFALNHQIAGKMGVIFERVNDMWEGKSGDSNEQKPRSKGKSKVSVSQPISGRPQMHQPSRADHLGTQNQSSMMPTAQPVQRPPQVQQQPAQDTGATSQNMYMDQTGDGNLLISAQEPMAANMALGGGGSWSAW
ncbi:hypothetical protein N9P79_00540 [Crocinitomicaceae bacterium]|jgi:hypothetical protein|nr:hypothetical protein [Crocinitomicaceae bacterium]